VGFLYAKIYVIIVQFFISPEMLLSPCRTPPPALCPGKIKENPIPLCTGLSDPVLQFIVIDQEEEEEVNYIQPSSEGHLNP
jgi:hypothetical protein